MPQQEYNSVFRVEGCSKIGDPLHQIAPGDGGEYDPVDVVHSFQGVRLFLDTGNVSGIFLHQMVQYPAQTGDTVTAFKREFYRSVTFSSPGCGVCQPVDWLDDFLSKQLT